MQHGVSRGPIRGPDRCTGDVVELVVDATSGMGVPLSQVEWDAFFDLAGEAPSLLAHSHGWQDASGNIAPTVGGQSLAATGLAYQQAVAGWTRTGCTLTEATTDAATFAGGTGPNPASVSSLMIAYVDIGAASTARQVMSVGGAAAASECTYAHLGNERPRSKVMAVTVDGLTDESTPGVLPVVLLYDRTNTRVAVINNIEVVAGTYNAGVTDGVKGFGAGPGTLSAAMTVLWSAWFSGANAEWSNARIKAVLQALGWTIPW